MPPSLAVIIVSWNVRELLERCLHSVAASLADSPLITQVIVVDNASHDGTTALVRDTFPEVQLLEPGRNLGFVAGNNLALWVLGFGNINPTAQQQPGPPPTDYVLLLNPDTEVVERAIPKLVTYLQQYPDLVAVGPQLCYPDGTIQSSRRRFPERLTFFWESTPLERLWPQNPWAQHYHCADLSPTAEQQVDWVVGAALLVRGATIQSLHPDGLLDERFFMYSEELEWQARLQQCERPPRPTCGSRVAYLPTAQIIHYEGRSSLQVPVTRHWQFQRSRLLLAQLWYGVAFARRLRDFLWGCYFWELFIEAVKYLVGHRRDLRRQRLLVYGLVLEQLRQFLGDRH